MTTTTTTTTTTDKLLKSVDRDIRNFEKLRKRVCLMRTVIDLMEQEFPQGSWSVTWLCEAVFALPFDNSLVLAVKEFVATKLPEFEEMRDQQYVWDNSVEAGRFLEWSDGSLYFEVSFRTSREGSVCVLNQIGTKVVPVYEVVCSQEAADELL